MGGVLWILVEVGSWNWWCLRCLGLLPGFELLDFRGGVIR